MRDLPPMEPCPYNPTDGSHEIAGMAAEDLAGDMTFFCARCGTLRRVPSTGSMLAGTPLDDWPANAQPITKES